MTTWRWGEPPQEVQDDGHSDADIAPHGWSPGGYMGPCRECAGHAFGAKRVRVCRPCAVKALNAVRNLQAIRPRPVDPIAAAVAAEREACAVLVEPKGPRPCDCDRCTCMNTGDLRDVTDWDTSAALAAAIRGRSAR
ncbi:hypothetical protein ASG63_08965 [Methylobacterium sp. Leaf94]|nr:hypothetical protein ASG63_08965 [Methylobacterium sp. Leaf94]